MQLRFTYTFEDFKQLSLALTRRYWYGKVPLRAWVTIAILCVVGAGLAFAYAPRGSFMHTWGGLMLIIPVGAILGGIFGLWYQIRSFYRKQKLDGLEVTYDIGPDGIRGQSSQYDSMIRWDGIEAVSAAPGYRFVWLNKLQGLVFPDRCFEGKQQMDEFDRLVRERLGSKAEL
jgi:hypothetical protein